MSKETSVEACRLDGWEIVIGLEVHAQIASQAKLFSGASAAYGGQPNTHVSLVDAAFPGMLPVLNRFCVEQAVRTGLGLDAHINLFSRFDRKNYFYPDLPQGYQISQFTHPIVGAGRVEVDDETTGSFVVKIERLHLEQDAGKSIHDLDPKASYVDLNRSGVALMEIVTKPDMRSGAQAAAFVKKLRTVLRSLGTCDGNMDEGSMRADVNVSVRRPGEALGTRCEIKNVNSMRFIMQAIAYEARRQSTLLEDGGRIAQQTRLFDAATGETRAMRSKEEAHDYRYFPDPDLLPLRLEVGWVEAIRASLPELPDAKKKRFMADYGLSAYDAALVSGEGETADFFERLAKTRKAKLAANWITGPLFGALNKAGLSLKNSPVDAKALGVLLDLLEKGTVSSRGARDVFEIMFEKGGTPEDIIAREGLEQMSDLAELEAAVDAVIAENPKQVEQAKAKPKALGWFVGQIMKKTGGKANPQALNTLLRDKLGLEE